MFFLALGMAGVGFGQPRGLPQERDSLQRFLQAFDQEQRTRFVAAFADLNGDGVPEAIVYLTGAWCGSGGCTMLVLDQSSGSWRIVANVTVVQTPVRVLKNVVNGWRSIGVRVQGGGIQPGYEAELRFNGKSYPANPTIAPALRSATDVGGEVVIASSVEATPLYADQEGAAAAISPVEPAGAGPSFDCAKASNPTERLVCRDPVLASLDRTLSAAFQRAVGRLVPEKATALRRDQANWFREYARSCNSATTDSQRWDCVDAHLRSRIEQFQKYATR
jgi:uncharacterized protein YecT (DUF1311 family)